MPSALEAHIVPARRLSGRLRVPGDKSISHRYALLSALAEGTSRITNYSPGADCAATLDCLRALGVTIHREADPATGRLSTIVVRGRGLGRLAAPSETLNAQNSGTTTRLLAGVLAAHPFTATITGDASLCGRPMKRVIDPLTRMGARIDASNGCAPLTITGGGLHPIEYTTPVPSAQIKSAVLLAGLHLRDGPPSTNRRRHGIIRNWRSPRLAGTSNVPERRFMCRAAGHCMRWTPRSQAMSRLPRSGRWRPPPCPDRTSPSRIWG